jgi:hypothetical protein
MYRHLAQSTNLGRMGRIRTLLGDVAYDLYGHRLTSSLPLDQLPSHVGVILDGNRRWAKEKNLYNYHSKSRPLKAEYINLSY